MFWFYLGKEKREERKREEIEVGLVALEEGLIALACSLFLSFSRRKAHCLAFDLVSSRIFQGTCTIFLTL